MIGIALERLLPRLPVAGRAGERLESRRGSSSGPAPAAARAGASAERQRGTRERSAGAMIVRIVRRLGAQARMSAQMLWVQPMARSATAALCAGVSFCSIWTTLPFSILYAFTTAMASRSLTQL